MPEFLHQIIDRSADLHPDKPAFVYGTAAVSYRDLVERAKGLAQATTVASPATVSDC